MFNAYVVILWLFVLSGLAVSWWGWSVIAAARRTLTWPQVDGVIERCDPVSEEDDLLPHITFSYVLNGQQQHGKLEFPSGTIPNPEFAAGYMQRYPVGSAVRVSYNPANNTQTTLEPGMGQGDWLILGLGVVATLAAAVSLIISE